MTFRSLILVPFVLLGVAGTLTAATIYIDPGTQPAGTKINTAFPGVTLSSVGIADGDVYAEGSSFAYNTAFGTYTTNWFDSRLRVDFAVSTDYVAIDATATTYPFGDTAAIWMYDAGDNLIDSVTRLLAGFPSSETASLEYTSPSANIAYMLAGDTGDGGVGLSNLRYNAPDQVPEPGTATIVLLGLCALGFYGKRRLGST